jgi:hypothetical protein
MEPMKGKVVVTPVPQAQRGLATLKRSEGKEIFFFSERAQRESLLTGQAG